MITVKLLKKSYNDIMLFDNFNLEVSSQEMVAIVGVSGSGKTTLLNIMGSLEPFISGEVIVDGFNLSKLSRKKQLSFFREHVSFLFQDYALMEDKTVYENVAIGKEFCEAMSVQEALDRVGLGSSASRKVSSLSGGEQQRISLARVMVKPSIVVFADEPTGNLDEGNALLVWRILGELRDSGKAIVVVTHDTQALVYFDRVVSLSD